MNAIICKNCGDIIVSRYSHDFKMCKCGKVGVDGGELYIERIGDFKSWFEIDDVLAMLETLKIGDWAVTYNAANTLEFIENAIKTICSKED